MDTSLAISLGALLVAFFGLVLNSRKETRTDAAANAIITTKLVVYTLPTSTLMMPRVTIRVQVSMLMCQLLIQSLRLYPIWMQRIYRLKDLLQSVLFQ